MKPFGGKFLVYVILVLLSVLSTTSGLLLSGMLFNYMIGSYLARGLMSSLIANSFRTGKSVVPISLSIQHLHIQLVYTWAVLSTSNVPGKEISTTMISQNQSPSSIDTMNAIGEFVQMLGIGEYMKDLFAEDECKTRKCRKKKSKRYTSICICFSSSQIHVHLNQ